MKRHMMDKFGNSLSIHQGIRERFDHVDVGYKKLRFVANPEESHDSVNRGYLEQFYVSKTDFGKYFDELTEFKAKYVLKSDYNNLLTELHRTDFKLEDDLLKLNTRVGDLSDKISKLQLKDVDHTNELTKITDRLKEFNERMDKSKTEYNGLLTAKLDELETRRAANLETVVNLVSAEHAGLADKVAQLQLTTDDHIKKLIELDTRLKEYGERLDKSKTDYNNMLNTKIMERETRSAASINRVSTDLTQLQLKDSEHTNKMEEFGARLKELNDQLDNTAGLVRSAVASYKDLDDSVTKTNTRLDVQFTTNILTLDSRLKTLEANALQYNVAITAYDAQGKKISNVADGQSSNDANTIKQTIVYDKETKEFKVYGEKIDIVVHNPKHRLVCHKLDDRTAFFDFKTGYHVRPYQYVYILEGQLYNSGGALISWDETNKKHFVSPHSDGTVWTKLGTIYSRYER